MEIKSIYAIYFSATGKTEKVVMSVASACAKQYSIMLKSLNITSPGVRRKDYAFDAETLVICGVPTYAGRVPNKLLSFLETSLVGNGALAIPIVTFGNRSFDNSLAELVSILEKSGFHTVAAGAFAAQHAFSDTLGAGRPDAGDMEKADTLAVSACERIRNLKQPPEPIQVTGDPEAPYYTPLGLDGEPKKFLRAKPRTDLERCASCGLCANLCPTGAIDPHNVTQVPGTCIKCHACIKSCPTAAKYFDDEAFLSHRAMLERDYVARQESVLFL